MKIKIKDEMNDIRLKVSHQELVILREALDYYYYEPKDIEIFNNELFDKDEFKDEKELEIKIWKMFIKISKKLENIHQY